MNCTGVGAAGNMRNEVRRGLWSLLANEETDSWNNPTESPGWRGSVDGVLACEPMGHWFGSQSGHMPGMQAKSPVGGTQDVSLPLFLPPLPSKSK